MPRFVMFHCGLLITLYVYRVLFAGHVGKPTTLSHSLKKKKKGARVPKMEEYIG
jgi:hypothetical protein